MTKLPSEGSSWVVLSEPESDRSKENKEEMLGAKIKVTPLSPCGNRIEEDDQDMMEFLSRQINSVSQAAHDTKSLFALSLGTGMVNIFNYY